MTGAYNMNAIFYVSDKSKDRHYEIRFTKQGLSENVWIGNAGGEAMAMEEQEFFDLIDKYFKDNF